MSKSLRVALALCCSFGGVGTALAQGTGGDIVVTAQFREQNLQDTPLSITAIDSAVLEARGQSRISDVADQAPNVTLKPTGGAFGPSMAASIRGIGQYDFNPALEPGVGIYVDDVYLPTLTGAQLDLLDLERVEVLRGPQGTLTGRNSIGGAIRLISQKPDKTFGGYAEAEGGSRDLLSFRGGLNVPLGGSLAFRLTGVAKEQDGYVDRVDYGCVNPGGGIPAAAPAGDCRVQKLGDYEYRAIRGALRFAPNDRLTFDLAGDYARDERTSAEVLSFANNPAPNASLNGVPYDSRFVCGPRCTYAGYSNPGSATWVDFTGLLTGTPGTVIPLPTIAVTADPKQIFEGHGASANLDYALTNQFSIVSITGWREYQSSFASDDDLSPLPVALGQNSLKHRFFSQEVRLNGALSDSLQFTLGGYYSDQKTTYFTFQNLNFAPFPLQFIGNDPVDADSKAAFATLIWKPAAALTITGGLRYTKESKDYTFVRVNPDGSINFFVDPTGTLNNSTSHYSGEKTDYRLSVDYRWSPNLLTYATTATGFKGGGIGPRPFIDTQAVPFDKENLTSYEIGLKADLFDKRLRLNASAFYNDYKDIQLTLLSCPQFSPPGFPCALPQNAGDAEVSGFELEAVAQPVPGLTLDASISALDFEYQTLDASTGVTTGDVAPFTPKLKWSAGAQYEFDLGAYGFVTPRVDATYQDHMYTNAVNGPLNRIGAYTLVNVRLAWQNPGRDITVALEGQNVTDKYYLLNRFDQSGSVGSVKDLPGRPREWLLSVRKTF